MGRLMATRDLICQYCRTTIVTPGAKRCSSCAAKHRWTQPGYRKKVSANIKRTHSTPEARAKMSAILHACWNDYEFRAKHKQSVNTLEYKAKRSAIAITSWSNPRIRRNRLEGIAKRERRKASNIEVLVKEFLEANFDEVIHQYVPDEDMSPGIYDFFVPSLDMIIEVDSAYWHTLDGIQKKDLEKEGFALEHGYNFIRITERDAKSPVYLKSFLKELLIYE